MVSRSFPINKNQDDKQFNRRGGSTNEFYISSLSSRNYPQKIRLFINNTKETQKETEKWEKNLSQMYNSDTYYDSDIIFMQMYIHK